MGQEQSVPTPRRIPNKLSKPRTNSTANLLSRSALQLEKDAYLQDVSGQRNRYSVVFADAEILVDVAVEKEKEKRRSVLRSLSTPDKQTLESKAYDEAPDRGEIQMQRWAEKSRHSSMVEAPTYQQQQSARPVNFPRKSLQHVPAYQSQQRLSLVTQSLTLDPDAPKRLSTYAELRSPTFADSVSNTDLPRTNSDTELYHPMRRRSFLQHGVATRPVLANDARQSLPSQINAQQFVPQYDNHSKPPLAYLSSLKQQDMPRVETPDELGYGHTGAFKLGTLRITNGVASPTPSIERGIERAVTMSSGEDYISAGSIRRNTEGHHRGESNRSNTFSISGERLKSPWIVREASPLRIAEKYSEAPPIIDDLVLNLDTSLADFDFDSTLESLKLAESPNRSQALADEYNQEIALSPYSFVPSRTPSPRLESTSKHTAIEDELFDAEPLTPSLSHTPSNTDSGYEAPSRQSSEPRQKPLAKADSGYSSNLSLRSFKTDGSRPPPVPAKDLPPTPPRDSISRVATSACLISSHLEDSIRLKYSTQTSDYMRSFESPRLSDTQAISKSVSRVPSIPNQVKLIEITAKSKTNKARQASAPDPLRSNPNPKQRYTRSDSDPKSIATSFKPVSKKEKQRPYSVQPQRVTSPIFTIQAQGQHEGINAPPIPYETARHLDNRVDSFPMTSFANTFKGLRRNGSKETLRTIFSVGSGFTEAPKGQELTRSRLQEALPAPPVPQAIPVPPPPQPLANSNSYHPPKTPPRKLKKRSSFAHEMAGYGDSNLGISESLGNEVRGGNGNLKVTKGSQSMTSEMDSDSANAVTKSRSISFRSLNSVTSESARPTTRKSYDSITSQNVWIPRNRSMDHIEPAPLSAPLQTPNQKHFLDAEQEPVQRRLSWGNRDKKPPPVSMQTQRKVTPVSNFTYKLFPTPPRHPPTIPVVPGSKDFPKAPSHKERVPSIAQSGRRPPPPPAPQKSLPPSPQPIQTASPPQSPLPQKSYPPSPLPIKIASPRNSPLPPPKDSPRPFVDQLIHDPWAEQKSYWSDRRQNANVGSSDQQRPSLSARNSTSVIQSQTYFEQQRPIISNRHSSSTIQSRSIGRRPPSVHQNGNLRIQKSMEAVRARQILEQRIYMQSTPNLRKSGNFEDINNPKSGSIDDLRRSEGRRVVREQFARQRERDTAREMLAGWQENPDGSMPGEYHHTYGLELPISPYSPVHTDKEYYRPESPEKEYFPPSSTAYEERDFNYHRQQTSTHDMLVLDRFSGGLAYGYEPGQGLCGSAGLRGRGVMEGGGRKSVDISKSYGLDFSDVPVLLTRNPGEEMRREVRYSR